MRIICDIETDSLKPTKIWCIVTKDVDTQEVRTFWRPDLNKDEFLSSVKDTQLWIGHFFIKFDYWKVLRVFFPELKIDPLAICDTHVTSKLFNFNIGEHGLEAWGERLGISKPKITDFNTVDKDEIINRCQQDVEINYKLWKKMEPAINTGVWDKSLELEHKMEFITLDMENNGSPFDYDETVCIRNEIEERINDIDVQIRQDFKPKCYLVKEVTPRLTQKGTLALNDFKWIRDPTPDLTPFTAGAPFSVIDFEEFNPASTVQIIERLNEAGWKPKDKTDGHIEAERECKRNPRNRELKERLDRFRLRGYKVNETNLATLPRDAPEGARKLAERILLTSRRSVLTEWINAYNPVSRCLHGRFNGIGAWTHRMSHQAPNQGNIPSDPEVKNTENPTPYEQVQLKYGMNLRKVWRVEKGERLLGVDADGIQLRIFAHYIEDEDFTNALVSGKKEDGTDPHTLNAVKLGIGPERRSMAKTFIYAFLLGAGVDKVAEILYTNNKGAREAMDNFIEGYPGLKLLKQKSIPKDAERGYFIGLDGRLVKVPSEHHVLAGYLQNGESVVMKTANLLWRQEARKNNIYFRQVNLVHDEFQTVTKDDDVMANELQKIQEESITQAGKLLGVKCPLLGQGQQGYSWYETH